MHNAQFTTTIKKNTPLSNLGNTFFFDYYPPFSYCSFTNRWLSQKRHHLFWKTFNECIAKCTFK